VPPREWARIGDCQWFADPPIGKLAGALSGFSAMELGGIAIREALARSEVSGEEVGYVIMGHVSRPAPGRSPPGRQRSRVGSQ
jgi:acetyl-CoA C-acetyltransferase